jgi:hypothetical protein
MCIWFAEKARAKEFRRRVQFGFLGKRERPAAEAASLSRTLVPWPEGHGFYRRLALRGHDVRFDSERKRGMAVEAPGFNPAKKETRNGGPSGPEVFGDWIDGPVSVGGGERKVFRDCGKVRADGIRVDVVAMCIKVVRVFDAALREAIFPDRHFGFEAKGESAFDELHGLLNGNVRCGREEEVDVIRHEDEGVELVTPLRAIVVHQVQKEICVRVGLEETAAIGGDGGDKEGADLLRGEFVHERAD